MQAEEKFGKAVGFYGERNAKNHFIDNHGEKNTLFHAMQAEDNIDCDYSTLMYSSKKKKLNKLYIYILGCWGRSTFPPFSEVTL